MRKTWTIAAVAAALAGLGGCQDSTAPEPALDGEDLAQLAIQTDMLVGGALFDQIVVAGAEPAAAQATDRADTRTRQFERTRECPAGGTITLAGETERVRHGDGVVEFFFDARGRQDDCAFERRRFKLTLNGEFELHAYRKLVNGEPVGPQTTTKAGWFSWVKTNAEGTVLDSGRCEYELTSVRHPDAGTRTVAGHICGRTVDRTVTWDRRG